MKVSFKKTSPNYRQHMTTQRIMSELGLALIVVTGFTLFYQFSKGGSYGFTAIAIILTSLIVAYVTELLFFVVRKEKSIIKALTNSFAYITAIIFALIIPVGTPLYVVAIGTFVGIMFGKLVYGGFGHNIFNPALVGRVFVTLSFGGKMVSTLGNSADAVSSPTITTAFSSAGWLDTSLVSLQKLWIGNYNGALGETFTLLILILGIVLVFRKVIDYRLPLTYIVTCFLIAMLVGATQGINPLEYGLIHLGLGGLMFGAIFMLTDPVTSPTSPLGKIIFAVGAAFFTMLIRFKANYPEGVLFSILLMNMLTPVIDRYVVGMTNKNILKKGLLAGGLVIASIGIITPITMATLGQEDVVIVPPPVASAKAEVVGAQDGGYVVKTKGFHGTFIVLVKLDSEAQRLISVRALSHEETEGYGAEILAGLAPEHDTPQTQAFIDAYIKNGATYSELETVDTTTGATVTSTGIKEAVQAAIKFDRKAELVAVEGNTYTVSTTGYYGGLTLAVTVNKEASTIASVRIVSSEESVGYGDDLLSKQVPAYNDAKAEAATAFIATYLTDNTSFAALEGVDLNTGATLTATGVQVIVLKAIVEATK